ncbi:MAG TPA: HAD-IB family hydrolase [Acidimicrobiales bacterium]|nr:HAD-IB family hydrolase [Acidimicrobiales bacterium]
MSAADRPGVAAFDFDGTLAHKDTFVPFLVSACGRRRMAFAAAACAGRTRDRDELKVALVGRLFRGWARTKLDALGRDYAAKLPDLLRPELLDRLAWHRDQGHAIVIVSASLAVYLRPLAAELGIDDVLAVELVADEAGQLTGAVVGGANTRGPLKAARLRAWLDARYGVGTPVELWAYGDSAGDEELLAAADHPTWIGKRATAAT